MQVQPYTTSSPMIGAAMQQQLMQHAQSDAADFFLYGVNTPSAIAAGGTVRLQFQINTDADFLAYGGVLIARNGSTFAAVDDPALRVNIFSEGSGRELQNTASMARNLFGTAERPCWFPWPRVFKGGQSVRVTLTSLEPSTTLLVDLGFLGVKDFNFRASKRTAR